MRTIAFNTFQTLNFIYKSDMSLLPAIFTLEDARVYVCSIDGGDVASHIEVSIN